MRITYEASEIASSIANHNRDKEQGDHYKEQIHHWEKLGIKNRNEFENHIHKTITHKNTRVYQAAKNRDIFYNKKTKLVVIVNPLALDKGTAFYFDHRDPKRNKRIDQLLRKDTKDRIDLGLSLSHNSHWKKGGDRAILDTKKIRRKSIYFRDNFKSISTKAPTPTPRRIKDIKKNNKQRIDNLRVRIEIQKERKQKRAEAKIENDRKKAHRAALQKKKELDAKIKLEAEKKKQSDLPKQQQAKNERIKEEAKQAELKRKHDKALQEELEKQRQREARLKALEEARKKALESTYLINKNDITKKL